MVVFATSQFPSAADFRADLNIGRSSGVRKAVGADIQWLTPETFHPIIKKARYTNFLKILEAPPYPLSLAVFRLNSNHSFYSEVSFRSSYRTCCSRLGLAG